MRPSRVVPVGYVRAGSVVLDGNPRLKWWLNVAAVPALLLAGCSLFGLAAAMRPDLAGYSGTFQDPAEALLFVGLFLAALLVSPVVVFVVHEAVHGMLFWLYTRDRPRFGFKRWYLYASAPGWYLSRNSFLVVGLGPLVAMSAVALGLAMVLPPVAAAVVLLGAALNAAGSLGDLYVCARLLAVPASGMVEDRPDGITWHVATTSPPSV
jgi:Putative zincin peptidase